jgi:hypothetical protein
MVGGEWNAKHIFTYSFIEADCKYRKKYKKKNADSTVCIRTATRAGRNFNKSSSSLASLERFTGLHAG